MPDAGIDPLSPFAHEIIKAAPYDKLVVTRPKVTRMLENVTPDQLLTVPIASYPHAYAMLAGLWLWHDVLEQSHLIAQMDAKALSSARYPHGKGSKTSLNVRSMESVENDKPMNAQQLEEATASFSFWHASLQMH